MKPKTCLSLSGRSTLSYVTGGNTLAIVGNSNAGVYDSTPVALDAIEQTIANNQMGARTKALIALFPGKSRNTAGFVLAAYLDHKRSLK